VSGWMIGLLSLFLLQLVIVLFVVRRFRVTSNCSRCRSCIRAGEPKYCVECWNGLRNNYRTQTHNNERLNYVLAKTSRKME